MRDIDTIVVHCSATTPNQDIGVEEIRKWHLDRGWNDIGYHYVINRHGEIENGRDVSVVGAHAKGHNKTSIGICLIGGVDKDNEPEANFTLEQYLKLKYIINVLKDRFDIDKVIGHREVANKACPCFDVHSLLNV